MYQKIAMTNVYSVTNLFDIFTSSVKHQRCPFYWMGSAVVKLSNYKKRHKRFDVILFMLIIIIILDFLKAHDLWTDLN